MRFSASVMTIERRSAPIMILSLARSNCSIDTWRWLARAANSAASFTRLARSAPENPGVPRAISAGLTSSPSGTRRMCTRRICSRPRTSGSGTTTWRSKRPGRSSAGSSTSGRLVAAMTMMPSLPSKPSISTSSWFRVCSCSSWPPPRPAPRWRPTASISSMKMMHGACFLACSNMSRTREAPTPTNISTKSEPEIVKHGTFRSDCVDFIDEDDARRVLLGLFEHVADARGADTDEHFHEVGTGDRKERYLRLTRDRACEQRLAGAGRTDHQHALGNLAPELLELARVLQEVDDFCDLLFGLIHARDIRECDIDLILAQEARARLAEGHGAAT